MKFRWTGPISVALFVPDVEFTIALVFIEYLRNCFPNVRNRVSFHMIYPGKKERRRPRNYKDPCPVLRNIFSSVTDQKLHQ